MPQNTAIEATVASELPKNMGGRSIGSASLDQSVGFGHPGTSCENPEDKIVSLFISSRMPITSRIAAETRSIARRGALTRRTNGRAPPGEKRKDDEGRPETETVRANQAKPLRGRARRDGRAQDRAQRDTD